MKGEPIEAVKVGVASMISALRSDPHSLDSIHIALMTFDREVRTLVPLTALDEFVLPEISVPDAGPTMTGLALEAVCAAVERDLVRTTETQKGDWRPLLFLMTDGGASDVMLFKQMVAKVKTLGFGTVVGCAAGPTSPEPAPLAPPSTLRDPRRPAGPVVSTAPAPPPQRASNGSPARHRGPI